jgi:competence protein ComEC
LVSGLSNPETNDASVVILLSHGNIKFLFPGDISSTVEATVAAHGTPMAAQILKIAHHGSVYSSSASFLSAVSPLEAITSVSDNSYGHPSADTISRLLAAGARIWRTDQLGTIIVVSDGTTYTIPSSTGYKVYLPLVMNSAPRPSTQTPTPPAPLPPAYPSP